MQVYFKILIINPCTFFIKNKQILISAINPTSYNYNSIMPQYCATINIMQCILVELPTL